MFVLLELVLQGSESTGVIPFVKVVDAEMLAFSQGVTRRGSYAAYLHITHPEIEFLDGRKPTGGDTNRRFLNLHHGCYLRQIYETIHRATKEEGYDDSWDALLYKRLKVVSEGARVKYYKIV